MTREEREQLIERVVSAWRPRGADGSILTLPEWHDLELEDRRAAFAAAVSARAIEAVLDPGGLSSTARAVLARIDLLHRFV
jgi:hypothetical protein